MRQCVVSSAGSRLCAAPLRAASRPGLERGGRGSCALRHCERSEAIQNLSAAAVWIASLRSQ
ncbi:hypothetical protein BSZ19_46285 [Bradyrhizobium japonicum]|uniref:Uncharacterized protein n=1 Tax=Bradyrhizobium japonicum TaxID=375 RepID=A0A1Y2J8S3_BRAJP|nr:hypothetical protein BSZ19_46285 [Bradyrhizobium japonicum]